MTSSFVPIVSTAPPPAEIKLPCGRIALIDVADLPLIEPYDLYSKKVKRSTIYVVIRCKSGAKPPCAHLHKLLTGWDETDHKNGDGLDCRRENLRECTHTQNVRNRRKSYRVEFKGASFHKASGRWRAQIGVNGKKLWGGLHDTAEAAARAYDVLARQHFGEFARLNFPDAHV